MVNQSQGAAMQQTSNENSIRYYGWAVAASLAITELTS